MEPMLEVAMIVEQNIKCLRGDERKIRRLNLFDIGSEQKLEFPVLWKSAKQDDDNYTIIDDVLYSFENENAAALEYLRLLQRFKYRKSAIVRVHN